MSTTKNLSEKLRQFGATDEDGKWAHLAAEARALEELWRQCDIGNSK